jgi:hypothetical protein
VGTREDYECGIDIGIDVSSMEPVIERPEPFRMLGLLKRIFIS